MGEKAAQRNDSQCYMVNPCSAQVVHVRVTPLLSTRKCCGKYVLTIPFLMYCNVSHS
jgi:hypothetical protein